MLWSLVKPAYFEVMYWFTPATIQAQPIFLLKMVSSAVPVFLLRMTEDERRLWSASSNMLAALSFSILLLLFIYYIKKMADKYIVCMLLKVKIINHIISFCYYLPRYLRKRQVPWNFWHLLNFISSEVVNIRCSIYDIAKCRVISKVFEIYWIEGHFLLNKWENDTYSWLSRRVQGTAFNRTHPQWY